jgi:hypothetical protein
MKRIEDWVCKVEAFGGVNGEGEILAGFDVLHKSANLNTKPMRIRQGITIPRIDPQAEVDEEGNDQLYNFVSANLVALARALSYIDRDRKGKLCIMIGNPVARELIARRHWWNRRVSIRNAHNEQTRIVLKEIFENLRGVTYWVPPSFPALGEQVVSDILHDKIRNGQVIMTHK